MDTMRTMGVWRQEADIGLSGSKSTTTNTTGPSKEALPYLTSASSSVQNAYNSNQGNLDSISSGLSNAFQAKLAQIQGGGDPTAAAARSYTDDVLGGKYLGQSNPFTSDIIKTTNNDIMDNINAIFSKSGQTGSSRQEGELAKQLSANESNLLYNDYNNERSRMDTAAGTAASLAGLSDQDLATLLSLGGTAATTPYLGAQFLSSGLGGLWGDSKTTTGTEETSGGLGAGLGSILSGGAALIKAFK